VANIEAMVREQADASKTIVAAMGQISSLAKQSSGNVEELTETADNLKHLTDQIQLLARLFRLRKMFY
jgi:methyl-accepting chemotaxis protein